MRKFLALVLALVMTMSLVTVSAGAATDFTDDAKIVNTEAVEVLSAMGVLGGYADGSFRPEATLTRGAGAKLIAYLMLGQAKADKLVATYTVFEDVTDTVGLAPYIEWAAANGIVGGYGNGNFGPYDTLTQYAFGKMLLGVLGYDSKIEGYVGAGWQKNVYGDANYAGIFDGTETYAACTRDDAARMALGALKANVVAYGQSQLGGDAIYWNGILLTAGVDAWVDGRVETNRALWTFYPGLTYYNLAADVFGRPGHKWVYGLNFEKFYMETPVAEYTTAVTDCDILVDFGVAKVNGNDLTNVQFIDNGVATTGATSLNHPACTNPHGDQGVLTQLFKVSYEERVGTQFVTKTAYVVTSIDTYLAQVTAVKDLAHKVPGATSLKVSVSNNAAAADWASAENTMDLVANKNLGYAVKDYVLINAAEFNTGSVIKYVADEAGTYAAEYGVTYGTLTCADSYAYAGESTNDVDGTAADNIGVIYVGVVGAPSVISGATYSGRATDYSKVTVNGVRENVAAQYEKTFHKMAPVVTAADCKVVDFFVDQYGNMIGDVEHAAAYTYGVISAAKWMDPNSILEAEYAEVAFHSIATPNGEAIKVATIVADDGVTKLTPSYDATVNRAAAKFSDIYAANAVYSTTELGIIKNYGNGVLEYIDTEAEYVATASFVKGNPNVTGMTTLVNNNTNFLVKTGTVAAPVYTTYAGIGELPSITNAPAVAVKGADGIYATFVFIDATSAVFAGNQTVVFVADADAQYVANSEVYEYTAFVNGASATLFATKDAVASAATGAANGSAIFGDGTDGAGLFKLTFDANGMIVKAEVATYADDTLDGTVYDNYMIKIDTGITTGTVTAKGLDVSAAKVYVAESLVNATDWTKVENVIVGDMSDLTDGATVKVKLVDGSTYVVDEIYVLNKVAELTK